MKSWQDAKQVHVTEGCMVREARVFSDANSGVT